MTTDCLHRKTQIALACARKVWNESPTAWVLVFDNSELKLRVLSIDIVAIHGTQGQSQLTKVLITYQFAEREKWLIGTDLGHLPSPVWLGPLEYSFVARSYPLDYHNLVQWLHQPADDRQHNPSLDTRRSYRQSQCDELASNDTSAIRCSTVLQQQFFRGRVTSTTAKVEDANKSSVSSESEKDDIKSFHYGKSRLQEWKQGAGKSKSWNKGPTMKHCGYHKLVSYCVIRNLPNHE
jgi:hypothetical protein